MFGSKQSSSRYVETSLFKMLRNVAENSQKTRPRKSQETEKVTSTLNKVIFNS